MITLLALVVVPWLVVSFLAAVLLAVRGVRRARVVDLREREFSERGR